MESEKPNSLSIIEQTVLDLTANALFGLEKKIPEDVNWMAVWEEALVQAVEVIDFADSKSVPSEVRLAVKSTIKKLIARNVSMDWEHAHVHEMMSKAGIPYVILKGYASASYYPVPMLRGMGDVDFLIASEDLQRAGETLKEKGYKPWDENHICHVVYKNEVSRLEVHFEPSGIPNGRAGELVREYLSDTLAAAEEIETQEGKMRLPSVFHHGLIILLHTSHHLTGGGIGLRHLCDWAVFAASLTDEEFCSLFEEPFKAIGMWKFAQVLTQTSIRFLGAPKRKWVGEEDKELTHALIKDILAGGNFGQKDASRGQESLLISSHGKDGVGNKSSLRQLIISMNEIVFLKWPVSKNIKIILPFGWIFYGGRYLVRMIMGKRPGINLKKVTSEAALRKELYSRLDIFEIK